MACLRRRLCNAGGQLHCIRISATGVAYRVRSWTDEVAADADTTSLYAAHSNVGERQRKHRG